MRPLEDVTALSGTVKPSQKLPSHGEAFAQSQVTIEMRSRKLLSLAASQEGTRHTKTSKNNPRNAKTCQTAAQNCLEAKDGLDVAVMRLIYHAECLCRRHAVL